MFKKIKKIEFPLKMIMILNTRVPTGQNYFDYLNMRSCFVVAKSCPWVPDVLWFY
jgi:hypothetical protein